MDTVPIDPAPDDAYSPVPADRYRPGVVVDAVALVRTSAASNGLTAERISRRLARGVLRTSGWTDKLSSRELAAVMRQFPVQPSAVQAQPEPLDQVRTIYDQMRERVAGQYLTEGTAFVLVPADLIDALGEAIYKDLTTTTAQGTRQ